MWKMISNKRHREIIGWLGAGVAAIATGGWAVYTYISPIDGGKPSNCTVVKVVNGVATCRDLRGDVHINSEQPRARRE
jgi:hypothetical protein